MERTMDAAVIKEIDPLVDYIMKNCLWQFHSRAWDRTRQNANILGMTEKLLCDEPVDTAEALERCYWVDAVILAESYRKLFPWVVAKGKAETKRLMQALLERIEFLTVTGSLNKELTDQNY